MEMERNEWEAVPERKSLPYPTAKREWLFAAGMLIVAMALANFVLYGGFSLGFAIGTVVMTVITALYLLSHGHKLTGYSSALLILSLVITAGFARSDDGFVKFVMVFFLLVAENLGLCLLAGKNLRNPGTFQTVWDAFRTLFSLGLGQLPYSLLGLRNAARNSGRAGKVGGSLLRGLLLAVPLLAVVILLLVQADAAFNGLVSLLPEVDGLAVCGTLCLGTGAFCWLFTRGTALHHGEAPLPEGKKRKGVYPLTVNTVLGALCLVYLVYLFSQLAYFVGGFAGILPEGFTMAEYARRGFFEMAWLCVINLGTVAIAVGVVEKKGKTPLSTRLLCLFISLITLFFVVAASTKMGMYIGSYGLTRLRVLTEVIMLFLAITTIVVAVWLFVPRLPYMKAVLLVGLVMGALVLWADVDTVVASYNVSAYLSGRLESVDVTYLASLSDGAVPSIAKLLDADNKEIASLAWRHLQRMENNRWDDFRDWNYVNYMAEQILSHIL